LGLSVPGRSIAVVATVATVATITVVAVVANGTSLIVNVSAASVSLAR
jgi:hypothetical protein